MVDVVVPAHIYRLVREERRLAADWNPFSHPCVDNPFPSTGSSGTSSPCSTTEDGILRPLPVRRRAQRAAAPSLYKSSHGITLEGLDSPDQLLNKDDPEHIVHRKIVSQAFTVSAIGKLEPKVAILPASCWTRHATAT